MEIFKEFSFESAHLLPHVPSEPVGASQITEGGPPANNLPHFSPTSSRAMIGPPNTHADCLRSAMSFASDLEFRDARVTRARDTLAAGGHLSQEDGVQLFEVPLMELGRLAHAVARVRDSRR